MLQANGSSGKGSVDRFVSCVPSAPLLGVIKRCQFGPTINPNTLKLFGLKNGAPTLDKQYPFGLPIELSVPAGIQYSSQGSCNPCNRPNPGPTSTMTHRTTQIVASR